MSEDAPILVYVSIDGQDALAGTMYGSRRHKTESASFAYYPEYLRRPDAYALDPAMPLSQGAFHTAANQKLFGAFRDCSPDRWGRTLVGRAERDSAKNEHRAPRSLGELDYLLGVRDDLRQGALRFRHSPQGPFLGADPSGVPELADLGAILDLAGTAEDDATGLEELRRLVRAGSSLGGARPKAHVRDIDGRVAIAKFPSKNNDTWNVMAWEKVALDLARAAGIDVPDSRLEKVLGRHVLIVNRFDRRDGQRVGYTSAMTMLEASDGDERSYLEIAEVIEERSDRATRELEQLWRRVVFSILISNTDDHLRNHGFLHQRSQVWRLSPAFDLNPNPEPGPKYLSNAIDESETRADVDVALDTADFYRLDAPTAREVLREVHVAVRTWEQVARRAGLGARERADMRPAFDHQASERADQVVSLTT